MKLRYSLLAYGLLWLVGILLALCVGIGLTGCTRPLTPADAPAEPAATHDPRTRTQPDTGVKPEAPAAPAARPDVAPAVTARPVLPANPTSRQYRAFKRELAAWERVRLAEARAAAGPKKLGKGATYAPNAAGNVAAGYKTGPVLSGDSSRLTNQAGAGVASTIDGNGNAPVLSNTQPKPPSLLAVLVDNLTKYLGFIIAGVLVLLLLLGYRRYKAARTIV